MATVTIEYFGMDGQGRTVTEAKRNAGEKIERALKGSYQPRVIHRKNCAALLYREPSGWHYSLLTKTDGTVRDDLPCGTFYGSLDDAEQAALFHVTQNAWDGEEGEALDSLLEGMNKRNVSEMVTWARWQLRWRHAVANGLTRDQAWDWASAHTNHAEAMASVPVATVAA